MALRLASSRRLAGALGRRREVLLLPFELGEGELDAEILRVEPLGEPEQLARFVVALQLGEPPRQGDQLVEVSRTIRRRGHGDRAPREPGRKV